MITESPSSQPGQLSGSKRRRSSTARRLTLLSNSKRRQSSVTPGSFPTTVFEKWSSKETEHMMRCNSLCKSGALTSGTDYHTTLWETFKNGLAISRNRNCLGWRQNSSSPYQWWSYEQFAEKVQALAVAFKRKTSLRRGDIVGICAPSSPNWLAVAYACAARSLILAPIYDTLNVDTCYYIISETNMTTLFVGDLETARRLLSNPSLMPHVATMVISDRPNDQVLEADLMRKASKAKITVVTLEHFLMTDANYVFGDFVDAPTENDICYVNYTSGTTGPPKGAMITHRAAVSNMISIDLFVRQIERPGFQFSENDVCLALLPFSHGCGLLIANWFLYRGASIGFHSGDTNRISDDAAILKPTFIPLIPRLMNSVYATIVAQVGESNKGSLKSKLFWRAYANKKEMLQKGTITRGTVWDKLAFRKFQQLTGGRVWLTSVGSATVSADVVEFWQVVFGCLVVESYGLAECSAVTTLGISPNGGNVGHPVQCNYIKLIDSPACNYLTSNGQGEICVKGSNVMLGLFKQPDLTSEALDEDGWLHTGDIGEFLPNGALRIIERKANIFQLSTGISILPEKVESAYAMCHLVSHVFVDGLSTETYAVAIVVPDKSVVSEWAKRREASTILCDSDPLDNVGTVELAMKILKAMRESGSKAGLGPLEQVRSIYLVSEPFTPQNGLATPTMKNRRSELRRRFRDRILAMYKAGPMIDDAENVAGKSN